MPISVLLLDEDFALLLGPRLFVVEEKVSESKEAESAGVSIEAERADDYQELTKVEVADKVVL